MATINNTIASISLISAHPLSGERHRRGISPAQGRSSFIMSNQSQKVKHVSEIALVNRVPACYNGHRKNALCGIFPNYTLHFIYNRTLVRMGGYFFLFIASKYPVATTNNTIASASVISLTPFRGKDTAAGFLLPKDVPVSSYRISHKKSNMFPI